jgi:hypothetical protein
MTPLSKTHSVTSARDRYDRARMRRLYSLTIIKGDANGGAGELRPQRGSSEVMIGTACATPEEFTAIGTEGVIFPTPFEVTRKAMTIHVHPARRASLRLRHGCLPGSPGAISPRVATSRFPPLFADAIRRGASIRGPESTQGRRASPRPVCGIAHVPTQSRSSVVCDQTTGPKSDAGVALSALATASNSSLGRIGFTNTLWLGSPRSSSRMNA